MTSGIFTRLILAVTVLFGAATLGMSPLGAADEKAEGKKGDKKEAAAKEQEKEASDEEKPAKDEEKATGRFTVPDSKDPEELVKFVMTLKRFRPRSQEEFIEHMTKSPVAIKSAAEKIIELEKDKPADASAKAKVWLLEARAEAAGEATPKEQKQLLADVISHIKSKKGDAGIDELRLAVNVASSLEQAEAPDAAIEAYQTFYKLFKDSKTKQVAEYAGSFEGVVRRLKLPGNQIEIKGKLADGSDFDWSKYKGKVVLVDYWATWCGPCRAELPNVKANYEKYHDKGFEVIGISLDADREKLEDYLKKEEIPWATLFEDGAGWQHSMAKFYGIHSIPTVILVDQKGKVVSLKARGPELGKLLEECLGKDVTK